MKDLLEQRHKEFEEKFPHPIVEVLSYSTNEFRHIENGLLSFHDQSLIMLLEKVREMAKEQELFILNVLNGVDVADAQMQNESGGTKAIRLGLSSRVPLSSLLTSAIEELKK